MSWLRRKQRKDRQSHVGKSRWPNPPHPFRSGQEIVFSPQEKMGERTIRFFVLRKEGETERYGLWKRQEKWGKLRRSSIHFLLKTRLNRFGKRTRSGRKFLFFWEKELSPGVKQKK